MSRRIPPIPVAAPWNGSTADGWLWLSTLNATASPSPRSTTPAFSPGPWRTPGESVGKRFRSSAECLYPQCSDQRSEKTASSKWFGSRSSSSWIRSSSPSVRPRARWSGCSATRVRDSSLATGRDGSRIVGRRCGSRGRAAGRGHRSGPQRRARLASLRNLAGHGALGTVLTWSRLLKAHPASSPTRSYSGKSRVSVRVVCRICDSVADR